MAELIQNPDSSKGKKATKRSTRVDLTPMVDLGFLLITFFIFTTTMSAPKAMKLIMPDDRNPQTKSQAPEGGTLQLILEGDNKISYFNGSDSIHSAVTDYSFNGIRQVIQAKQKEVKEKYHGSTDLIVLITPENKASYRNVVDVLDEMLINDVKRYMLLTDQN